MVVATQDFLLNVAPKFYNDFKIILFALSTAIVSNEARYMRVVVSESCPIPLLIIEIGTFLLLAMLAQE